MANKKEWNEFLNTMFLCEVDRHIKSKEMDALSRQGLSGGVFMLKNLGVLS